MLRKGMVNFSKERLDIDMEVRKAHRLGPKASLVKMEYWQNKMEMMRNNG